jgi:hypothetical protein
MNDDELRKCSLEGDEFVVITATLDGQPIQKLEQYRTQTGFFNITFFH